MAAAANYNFCSLL